MLQSNNKIYFLGVGLLIAGLFLIGLAVNLVYAENVGIMLSNTCKTMIKNNITTNCPTNEELLLLFPDQSNHEVSGQFENVHGIYQRNNKQLDNHFRYYDFDNKPRLWIDPPSDILEKIKVIIITSNDFVYPISKGKITNSTIELGQSRYIDKCHTATITANNWYFLTGDTIQTLLLNCAEGSSNFNEVKIIKFAQTHHDITTSAKYKLEKRIQEIKENCLTEFMKCKDGVTYKRTLSDSLSIQDRF